MQAQTAARFEDILAHGTFTGAGGLQGQPSAPIVGGTTPDQSTKYGARGISHPRNTPGAGAPPPKTNRLLLAVREDGGVVWSSGGAPFAHPVSYACYSIYDIGFALLICLIFSYFRRSKFPSKKEGARAYGFNRKPNSSKNVLLPTLE